MERPQQNNRAMNMNEQLNNQGFQTATGQGQYESHIEVSGNFKTACQNMLGWIKEKKFMREQIISISANETTCVDGDAVLVLVYKRLQDPSMITTLEGLQYHLVSSVQDWGIQYKEIEKIISERCEILSLTHTPRNIGQMNIQILWFLPPSVYSPQTYTNKHFKSQKSFEDAMEQARLFLDEWVPPHRLVNVSAFEEDHPNQSFFNVVVLVRGNTEKPIQPPVGQRDETSIGKIYNFKTLRSDETHTSSWETLLSQGLAAAESHERGVLSTFNLSTNKNGAEVDVQAVLAVTWSKTHEDMLVDSERGFCNCTIF